MALVEQALLARARRIYEFSRLRGTLRDTWVVLPIVAVGALHHLSWQLPIAMGATLFALATAFSWRGQAWGCAVWPGIFAGAVPLLVPGLVRAGSVCWIGGYCWSVCMLLCSASGVAAGLAVGIIAARQAEARAQFLASAALVAGVTGSIGCALAGIVGIIGMAAGGAVSLIPVYLGFRFRRA